MTHFSRLLLSSLLVLATACGGPNYPKCDEDSDCKDKEFCVNQQCQLCRDDNDCGKSERCNAGRCDPIENYCHDASGCGANADCVANRCIKKAVVVEEPLQTLCELRPVAFDYDADMLTRTARNAIAENLACFKERQFSGMHLTGHTDPRGTEEYNLALGDRRARAVYDYLVSLGMDASRMSLSSMGEEMSRGEDNSSWTNDRRVTFLEK